MEKYKVIDAHCHIYPDKIAEKAALSTGAFYGIDMHYDGKVSTLEEICARDGVDMCLIHSVATTPKQVSGINRFIAENVSSKPQFYIGFGALHPDSQTLDDDISELISLGLKGVKLHPDIQKIPADDERCLEIYKRIEGRIPLLIHCGDKRYNLSNPDRISHIADMFPNLTIIAAHFGGYSVWEEAARTLSQKGNIVVDSCSSFEFLTDDEIRRCILAYGADRVLFGSDYPMWNAGKEISRLLSLGLSERENHMILHKNAEKLLGI